MTLKEWMAEKGLYTVNGILVKEGDGLFHGG